MKKASSSKISKTAPRVMLRRIERADGPAIVAIARTSRALHRNRVKPPDTLAKFERYLAGDRDPMNARFVVVRIADHAVLGAINFSQIFYGQLKSAYMGYWIGAPFARQGYITEGMRIALQIAFRNFKLHRVEANIQPENIASIKLVQRLGFSKEGFSPKYVKVGGAWRDHERWALLAEDCRE